MHPLLLTVLSGYLLGSIPFGLLVGRLNGIDIRQHGSGNIGATNVLRTLGKKWGYITFALDVLKGVLAVVLVHLLPLPEAAGFTPVILKIASGLACIAGHNFPVWLKFKGGKGVATTGGVLVALLPLAALVAVAAWVITFYTTRYVSVASIVAAIAIPVAVWCIERQVDPLFIFSLVVAALGIWRHRANIQRLLAGTESRFERKKS